MKFISSGLKCEISVNESLVPICRIALPKQHPFFGYGYCTPINDIMPRLKEIKQAAIPGCSILNINRIIYGETFPSLVNIISIPPYFHFDSYGKSMDEEFWMFQFRLGPYPENYKEDLERIAFQMAALMPQLDPNLFPPFSLGKCDII